MNPYQYAVNTLGWIDPLGLECKLVTKTRELAETVSDKFKKMQKEGIAGEHLVVKTGSKKGMLGNIWSDAAGKNISTNGVHEAIKVGDTFFDNMNPSGVNYSSWAGDLFSPGGHSISSTEF